VGQIWAGKNWGAQYIPRVGQEVIVSYLDGDPDNPIVIGSVYNPLHMPPYALPDNAMQSGVKSQSAPGGDRGASNELRFDDKKDAEQIYLHAQKDMQVLIENNQTITVGGEKKDKGDRTTTVANDDTLNVKHDRVVNVDNDLRATIKHDETRTVQGKRKTDVTGEDALTAQSYKLKAQQEISFEVGAAKILMKSDGTVEISGVNVTVKGNNSVTIDGGQTAVKGVQLDMTGKKTTVDGAAQLDLSSTGVASLKGSLTKIG
jgi:type VI secretion system secreted protein VgrG